VEGLSLNKVPEFQVPGSRFGFGFGFGFAIQEFANENRPEPGTEP